MLSAVAKSTETARPLGVFRLTENVALTVPELPSTGTVTSSIARVGITSLSVIVPRPLSSAIVALTGLLRV